MNQRQRIFVTPTEHDVLCFQGGGTRQNPGNRRYFDAVCEYRPHYNTDRAWCIQKVIQSVVESGGRFVTKASKESTDWYLKEDAAVYTKVEQALRDGRRAKKDDKQAAKKGPIDILETAQAMNEFGQQIGGELEAPSAVVADATDPFWSKLGPVQPPLVVKRRYEEWVHQHMIQCQNKKTSHQCDICRTHVGNRLHRRPCSKKRNRHR